MTLPLHIQNDVALREYNTFAIDAKASAYVHVTSQEELLAIRRDAALMALPRMVLGGGSNILLTHDFHGLMIHVGLKGRDIVGEDERFVYVRAAGGENWHDLVMWTLDRNLGGLENLSLIPGTVGAAPVQNIGAYGAELKDCFHSLRAFYFETGDTLELSRSDCVFGYRDSIFKNALRDRAVILDVMFALPKQWRPNIGYAELERELAVRGNAVLTPKDVSDAVIGIRSRKLTDPAVMGNAGSFFKNPTVEAALRNTLLDSHPQMPSYPQPDGRYRLAAGWLIDQCGWKGKRMGAAGVSPTQALVLVNRGGATGADIAGLARAIQADVKMRFGILLEPEPVFV